MTSSPAWRCSCPTGVITLEFPHVLRLIDENQFDTIYHEHFSYFSLHTVEQHPRRHGLAVFDVEEIPTHGGSLRVYARHQENLATASPRRSKRLLRAREPLRASPTSTATTVRRPGGGDQAQAAGAPHRAERRGPTIAGYGAPGKGNTLLNYCGIRTDFIDYTVDRNPTSRASSCRERTSRSTRPRRSSETRPDYVFILPWNVKDEIIGPARHIRGLGRTLHRSYP